MAAKIAYDKIVIEMEVIPEQFSAPHTKVMAEQIDGVVSVVTYKVCPVCEEKCTACKGVYLEDFTSEDIRTRDYACAEKNEDGEIETIYLHN